ncbi:MAG: glycosyltransferase [Pseudomonadota bacterium]
MGAPLRILILSSAVGRFGEGPTGGVSRYAAGMAEALGEQGMFPVVLVPEGSEVPPGIEFVEASGNFQLSAATADRNEHPVPAESVLARMLDIAWSERENFDRIVNLNHDYLPVFSTAYFDGKLYHLPNLVTSDAATDALIRARCSEFPSQFAAVSAFQRGRLGLPDVPVLSFGMRRQKGAVERGQYLCWSGRITPEKGLDAAAEVARQVGLPLVVAGHVESEEYFAAIRNEYDDLIDYRGFLKLLDLSRIISSAQAMLQTQNWEEALGLSTIEAIATGTPVVAYDRGANREIVRDGVNGFVVEHGNVAAAAEAVRQAGGISRQEILADFDLRFSLRSFARRLMDWLGFTLEN